MGSGGAVLALLINATDNASKVLDGVGGSVSKLGSAVRKAALGAGLAAAGTGLAATKMAVDFEASLAEVRTLLPSLSDDGFVKLQDDVLAFSRDIGIATADVVPALYQAISAGVPADNALTFMQTAAQASIGGVTDLETAVDGITSVVNSYGAEVITAQEAADLMFTGVKLGKTTFDELANSLFNVVPTASTLGVGFDEITAALSVMTAQGVPTSVATTQMRQALVELSKSGTVADKAIREMAGKGLADLIDEGATVLDVLQDLRVHTEDQGLVFNDLFGSVEAMNAALALTGQNSGTVQSAFEQMQFSTGAVGDAFDTVADTSSFQFNKTMNALKTTLIDVGLQILPTLNEALSAAGDVLIQVADWVRDNRTGIQQFFRDTGEVVETLWGHFQSGFEVVWPAVRGFFNFLLDNKPLLIAAIVGIGIAIVTALGPVSGSIAAIAGIITLIGFLRDNWDEIWDAIKSKATEIWTIVESLFRSKWGWLLPAGPLVKAIFFFKDNWRTIWDGAVSIWENTSDRVRSIGTGLIDWFGELPGRIGRALTSLARIITFPFRTGMAGARSVLNAVIGGFNSFPTFTIPDIPGIPGRGSSISLPKIPLLPPLPEFAEGGIVPGRIGAPVIAKVHGGEAIIPPGKGFGTVIQVMPGAFSFPNFVGDREDLERSILDALVGLERTGQISGVTA